MGRVASVANVARSDVAVGSASREKTGWGLSEIRERWRSRTTVAGRRHDILLAREPVVRDPGGLFARGVSCRARRRCGRPGGLAVSLAAREFGLSKGNMLKRSGKRRLNEFLDLLYIPCTLH